MNPGNEYGKCIYTKVCEKSNGEKLKMMKLESIQRSRQVVMSTTKRWLFVHLCIKPALFAGTGYFPGSAIWQRNKGILHSEMFRLGKSLRVSSFIKSGWSWLCQELQAIWRWQVSPLDNQLSIYWYLNNSIPVLSLNHLCTFIMNKFLK